MRVLMAAALAGLVAGPVWADSVAGPVGADSAARPPGTVSTHATARARLPNTVADVSIGVEAHAPTVQATQAALTSASNRLLGYLRQQGVERLRTEQVSVSPHTVADKGQPARIAGYDGRVRAGFRVPAERLGAVIAGALENGGNDLQSTSLTPRESEMDGERQRLAAEAARTALAQARAVAAATGRQVGAIRRLEVDPSSFQSRGMAMARIAAMPAPPMPMATEAGDVEMTAEVSVTVDLVEPNSP